MTLNNTSSGGNEYLNTFTTDSIPISSFNPTIKITTADCTTAYSNYNNYNNNYNSISILVNYLNEEEIKNILSIIKERDTTTNKSEFKDFLKSLILVRHFSEDFLMEYIEYLTLETIKVNHKADICSLAYGKVVLYFETKKF